MCKLISYAVPEGPPYYGFGANRLVAKCETHCWVVDPVLLPISADTLCPIGRIEKAIEDGLDKIAAAAEVR